MHNNAPGHRVFAPGHGGIVTGCCPHRARAEGPASRCRCEVIKNAVAPDAASTVRARATNFSSLVRGCTQAAQRRRGRVDAMSFLEPLETAVIKPLKEFAKDSIRLVKRCEKPDRKGVRRCSLECMHRHNRASPQAPSRARGGAGVASAPPGGARRAGRPALRLARLTTAPEFMSIAFRTGLGFFFMGFIGFFVKLVLCAHEP